MVGFVWWARPLSSFATLLPLRNTSCTCRSAMPPPSASRGPCFTDHLAPWASFKSGAAASTARSASVVIGLASIRLQRREVGDEVIALGPRERLDRAHVVSEADEHVVERLRRPVV